jgi:hypothetical protein
MVAANPIEPVPPNPFPTLPLCAILGSGLSGIPLVSTFPLLLIVDVPTMLTICLDGLDWLTLPLKLIPEKEKETLQDMCQAAIGNAVGRNYIFSKMGKFISKAQLAYFNSPPPMPLVDSLKSSDTDEMLAFFEQSKDISYHVLWDVPIPPTEPPSPRKTALVSSLRSAGEDGSMEILKSVSLSDDRFGRLRFGVNSFGDNSLVL